MAPGASVMSYGTKGSHGSAQCVNRALVSSPTPCMQQPASPNMGQIRITAFSLHLALNVAQW